MKAREVRAFLSFLGALSDESLRALGDGRDFNKFRLALLAGENQRRKRYGNRVRD